MSIPTGTIWQGDAIFSGEASSISGELFVNGSSSAVSVTLGTTRTAGGQTIQPWSVDTTGLSNGDELRVDISGTVDGESEQLSAYTVLDASTSSRSTHSPSDVWNVSTRTLTSFGSLVSDIWSAGTRTLTSVADSSGVTTLLSRLSAARATLLDKLDVSGTLAHSDDANTYQADTTGLASQTSLDTVDSVADAIKAKTDQLAFTSGDVHATLDGEEVTASNMRGTDDALLDANYTAPDNAGISTAATEATEANTKAGAIQTVLSGITRLAHWLRAIARSDEGVDATAISEINDGTGDYDNADHSIEAIRDRGDSAWTTGSTNLNETFPELIHTSSGVVTEIPFKLTSGLSSFTVEKWVTDSWSSISGTVTELTGGWYLLKTSDISIGFNLVRVTSGSSSTILRLHGSGRSSGRPAPSR